MSIVLKFPLTTVPLSLCHVDGTMHSTAKAELTKYLNAKVQKISPKSIDVTIVDAAFLLWLHSNMPDSFGGVAKYLLQKLVNFHGNFIHFVTDKWMTPSIKDLERQE